MAWYEKIIFKIASEVHKNKIEDFEKRIVEMEKYHEVFKKTIIDNECSIKDHEKRIYNLDMLSSSHESTIDILKRLAMNKHSNTTIIGGQENDHTIDK